MLTVSPTNLKPENIIEFAKILLGLELDISEAVLN